VPGVVGLGCLHAVPALCWFLLATVIYNLLQLVVATWVTCWLKKKEQQNKPAYENSSSILHYNLLAMAMEREVRCAGKKFSAHITTEAPQAWG
jgi:hypothetical protein